MLKILTTSNRWFLLQYRDSPRPLRGLTPFLDIEVSHNFASPWTSTNILATSTFFRGVLQQPTSAYEHDGREQYSQRSDQRPPRPIHPLSSPLQSTPWGSRQLAFESTTLFVLTASWFRRPACGLPRGERSAEDRCGKKYLHKTDLEDSLCSQLLKLNVQSLFLGTVCELLRPALIAVLKSPNVPGSKELETFAHRWYVFIMFMFRTSLWWFHSVQAARNIIELCSEMADSGHPISSTWIAQ